MEKLSFLTINVNGCRGVEKRFKFIEYLKVIPSDIIFLHETQSLEQDESFFGKEHGRVKNIRIFCLIHVVLQF